MVQYSKGKPTDPQYFNKQSVKSIKQAILNAKLEKPVEVFEPDTRFRAHKHRGMHLFRLDATQSTPRLDDYHLTNLSPEIDSVSIKKELARKGVQVLNININEHLCTQARPGTADIKVRNSGPETQNKLQSALQEIGIAVDQKPVFFNPRYSKFKL